MKRLLFFCLLFLVATVSQAQVRLTLDGNTVIKLDAVTQSNADNIIDGLNANASNGKKLNARLLPAGGGGSTGGGDGSFDSLSVAGGQFAVYEDGKVFANQGIYGQYSSFTPVITPSGGINLTAAGAIRDANGWLLYYPNQVTDGRSWSHFKLTPWVYSSSSEHGYQNINFAWYTTNKTPRFAYLGETIPENTLAAEGELAYSGDTGRAYIFNGTAWKGLATTADIVSGGGGVASVNGQAGAVTGAQAVAGAALAPASVAATGTAGGADLNASGATAPSVFWGGTGNLSRTGTGIFSLGSGARDNASGELRLATLRASGSVYGDGSNLTALNASNITSGTLGAARLPASITLTSLTLNGQALTLASGVLQIDGAPASVGYADTAGQLVGPLDAAQITTGTLDAARLPAEIIVSQIYSSGDASIDLSDYSNGHLRADGVDVLAWTYDGVTIPGNLQVLDSISAAAGFSNNGYTLTLGVGDGYLYYNGTPASVGFADYAGGAASADYAYAADTATSATYADGSALAYSADFAAHADDADTATTAGYADNAGHADNAEYAGSAVYAGSADMAYSLDGSISGVSTGDHELDVDGVITLQPLLSTPAAPGNGVRLYCDSSGDLHALHANGTDHVLSAH